ncbi:hypothetical protein HHL21_12245 [Massilia sp. RP-1-19]|uniref:Uncharacterized protein n=1 Tax=Massilia polaris TaxID=2728846 RepID=A0A848HPU9_9BURK|nr:hypothetical protein [Massilia polaris]NML61831.1 hypothetical protein [Massilia polaris]
MKIRMTKSIRGSLNGVTVDDLEEGQDYETVKSPLGERMGRAHIANYAAVELDDDWNPVVVEVAAPVDEPSPEPQAKSRKK